MTNREKYNKAFIDCFSVTEDMLNEEFVYQCIPAWDSVGHMGMIADILTKCKWKIQKRLLTNYIEAFYN